MRIQIFNVMNNTLRNSVQLIGNIGKDVEVVTFENGNMKASVSLATNDYYTNAKGEKTKQTEWHNLIAWGKTADLMKQVLSKGSEVAIHGKLTYRSYTDKSGNTKYITEVVVNEFVKLGKSEREAAVVGSEELQEVTPF
jgi:single-strand DNA-binding protein